VCAAADNFTFDHHDFGTESRRPRGGGISRRTTTNDDEPKCHTMQAIGRG
jgi:hypothetical protein